MVQVKHRNATIDGWRGVSVLMVFLGHFVVSRLGDVATGAPFRGLLTPPIDWFALLTSASLRMTYLLPQTGVQFFFVISGYLITSLLIHEEARAGAISIWAFYVRRFFRIVPAYICFLLAICLLASTGSIPLISDADLATAAAFLCNTTIHGCTYVLAHTWSLAVEEQFYLAWPLMFAFLGTRYRAPGLVVTIGLLLALSAAGWLRASWIDNGVYFASIGIGALYAASPSIRSRITLAPEIILVPAIAALLARPFFASIPGNQFLILLSPFLVGLVFFKSLLPDSRLGRLVSWEPLRIIGLMSYSLYLWQQLFTLSTGAYPPGSMLNIAALAFLLAAMSFAWVETPMVRIGRGLSDRVKAQSKFGHVNLPRG